MLRRTALKLLAGIVAAPKAVLGMPAAPVQPAKLTEDDLRKIMTEYYGGYLRRKIHDHIA